MTFAGDRTETIPVILEDGTQFKIEVVPQGREEFKQGQVLAKEAFFPEAMRSSPLATAVRSAFARFFAGFIPQFSNADIRLVCFRMGLFSGNFWIAAVENFTHSPAVQNGYLLLVEA